MGKPGRLWKQPPVNQGRDEIAYRLSLHQHLVVNQVVARAQSDHPNVEYAAPTRRLQQRRVSLGMIDGEPVDLSRHGAVVRWAHATDDDAIVRRVDQGAPFSPTSVRVRTV